MKINWSPLCLIFYKDELGLRGGKVIYGEAKGPIIWIRKDEIDNKGVLEHEFEHVRQAWRGFLIFHSLLLWIPAYREWTEVEAMKKQRAA
jgi:hypothetical protein